jgi:hypothetical protein
MLKASIEIFPANLTTLPALEHALMVAGRN